MRRLLLFVVCLAIGAATAGAQSQSTTNDAAGREITRTYTDAKGNKVWSHATDYDDAGRVVRKTSFDGNGNQTASFEYLYDERGNNTQRAWHVHNKGVLMKSELKYDDGDRVIEITNHGDGSMASNRTLTEYGPDGLRIREQYWPNLAREDAYFVTSFEWTDFGKASRTSRVNQDGAPVSSSDFEYNDKEQNIKTIYRKADGSVNDYYVYEYNDAGKQIRATRYNSKNELVGTTEY